jgi:hypothetical protein
MITPSKYRILFLALLLSASFLPVTAMATETAGNAPAVIRIEYPSVTRTWSTITLLYEGQFHDSDQVEEEIENMHSLVPQLLDVEVIGQSYLGENITCLRITNEENPVQKAKTLVVAHHHGREQITVEMALRFILRLLNGYGVDATITEYVDTQEIFVIPTLNPDALDVVVNDGNHWLRKNLRPYDNDGDGLFGEDDAEDVDGDGHISEFYVYEKSSPDDNPSGFVFDYSYYEGIDNDGDGQINEDEVGLVDLNRNYPVFWDTGIPDFYDVTTQVYHGTAPFSEPETQAFRDFALQHRFAMAYSLHSGINATYFVQDLEGYWVEGPLYYGMYSDYNDILPDGFNGYLSYAERSLEAATPGGWGEWLYYTRGCTAPITFELYTNASVYEEEATVMIENNSTHVVWEWKGIYGYFDPVASHIDTLWAEITPAFDYLLEMTPRMDISVTGVVGGITADSNVTLTTRLECLSPRLGSKDAIEVLAPDNSTITSTISISGGQTLIRYLSVTLEEDLAESDYVIRVGNEYTGYTAFRLTTQTGSLLDPMLLIGIGIGVAVIAVVLVVYRARTR